MNASPKLPAAPQLSPAMPVPTYEYEFHELANEYDLIEGQDFEDLVESVGKYGIRVPINRYHGQILDGRNRYRAAKAAGHKFTPDDFKDFTGTYEEAEEFVSSMNGHRRNLDTKQKRALIAKKINRHPDRGDRAIAKLTCCDHKTVASVREEMRKRVEMVTQSWRELSMLQRREFVTGLREEILTALGNSPA